MLTFNVEASATKVDLFRVGNYASPLPLDVWSVSYVDQCQLGLFCSTAQLQECSSFNSITLLHSVCAATDNK